MRFGLFAILSCLLVLSSSLSARGPLGVLGLKPLGAYSDVHVTPDSPFHVAFSGLAAYWQTLNTSLTLSYEPTMTGMVAAAPLWLTAALASLQVTLGGTCGGTFTAAVVSYTGLYVFGVASSYKGFSIYNLTPAGRTMNEIGRLTFLLNETGVDLVVDRNETFAVCLTTRSLDVINIRDINMPRRLGSPVPIQRGVSLALNHDEKTVYAATETHLEVFKLSLSINPAIAQISFLPFPGITDAAVGKDASTLFVVGPTIGFCAFNVSNALLPVLRAPCNRSLGSISRLATGRLSNRVFLLDASGTGRVHVINGITLWLERTIELQLQSQTTGDISVDEGGTVGFVSSSGDTSPFFVFSLVNATSVFINSTTPSHEFCERSHMNRRASAAVLGCKSESQTVFLSNPQLELTGIMPSSVAATGGQRVSVSVTDGFSNVTSQFKILPVPGWTTGTTGTTGVSTTASASTTIQGSTVSGFSTLSPVASGSPTASSSDAANGASSSTDDSGSSGSTTTIIIVIVVVVVAVVLLVVLVVWLKRRSNDGASNSSAALPQAGGADDTARSSSYQSFNGSRGDSPTYGSMPVNSQGEPTYQSMPSGTASDSSDVGNYHNVSHIPTPDIGNYHNVKVSIQKD